MVGGVLLAVGGLIDIMGGEGLTGGPAEGGC